MGFGPILKQMIWGGNKYVKYRRELGTLRSTRKWVCCVCDSLCFLYADSNVSLICVSLMRKFKLFRCEIQEKLVWDLISHWAKEYERIERHSGAPYIHGYLAHRLPNWYTRPLKHDRRDKKMLFLVAPVIYLVFRSGRINCTGNILLWRDVGQMWDKFMNAFQIGLNVYECSWAKSLKTS